MQLAGIDILRIKQRKNRLSGLVSGHEQKLRSQKTKNHVSDILPICPYAPTGAIGLNFGLLGHIADVITHAKFCDNWFRGFGVLIHVILYFSIGIAGRPYNSLNTTMLHCD